MVVRPRRLPLQEQERKQEEELRQDYAAYQKMGSMTTSTRSVSALRLDKTVTRLLPKLSGSVCNSVHLLHLYNNPTMLLLSLTFSCDFHRDEVTIESEARISLQKPSEGRRASRWGISAAVIAQTNPSSTPGDGIDDTATPEVRISIC